MLHTSIDSMHNAEYLWEKNPKHLLMWLGSKLVGVLGLFYIQMVVSQKDIILQWAFSRAVFQGAEDDQFYRRFTLEEKCNFHCSAAYCFLGEVSLSSTWCSLGDKHFNVEDVPQIMEFLNTDWAKLVLQMCKRPDFTSSSVCLWLRELEQLMNWGNCKSHQSLKPRTPLHLPKSTISHT